MRHPLLGWLFLIVAAAFGSVASAASLPANIKLAVADSDRPATDTERDANRKPTETLAVAGVKDGTVNQEVMEAGFENVRESNILANPGDPRTRVFDESIRGKTDQFILKFRKPKK